MKEKKRKNKDHASKDRPGWAETSVQFAKNLVTKKNQCPKQKRQEKKNKRKKKVVVVHIKKKLKKTSKPFPRKSTSYKNKAKEKRKKIKFLVDTGAT